MTRGGGGLSQKVICMTRGGGWVQTPPKKDDIICEQPLSRIQKYNAEPMDETNHIYEAHQYEAKHLEP